MHGSEPIKQNAGVYIPRQSMRKEVAADLRAMFNPPDKKQLDTIFS
jgi:hypothetical protein